MAETKEKPKVRFDYGGNAPKRILKTRKELRNATRISPQAQAERMAASAGPEEAARALGRLVEEARRDSGLLSDTKVVEFNTPRLRDVAFYTAALRHAEKLGQKKGKR